MTKMLQTLVLGTGLKNTGLLSLINKFTKKRRSVQVGGSTSSLTMRAHLTPEHKATSYSSLFTLLHYEGLNTCPYPVLNHSNPYHLTTFPKDPF
jgi:hypothetical protein